MTALAGSHCPAWGSLHRAGCKGPGYAGAQDATALERLRAWLSLCDLCVRGCEVVLSSGFACKALWL